MMSVKTLLKILEIRKIWQIERTISKRKAVRIQGSRQD